MRRRNEAGRNSKAIGVETASRYNAVSESEIRGSAIMEQVLEASIQFAAGDREAALRKAAAAGEAEDNMVFEFGPPTTVKPAWEAAGELLIEAGKYREAADAFRHALKRYPNRRLSNEGLKRAAESMALR